MITPEEAYVPRNGPERAQMNTLEGFLDELIGQRYGGTSEPVEIEAEEVDTELSQIAIEAVLDKYRTSWFAEYGKDSGFAFYAREPTKPKTVPGPEELLKPMTLKELAMLEEVNRYMASRLKDEYEGQSEVRIGFPEPLQQARPALQRYFKDTYLVKWSVQVSMTDDGKNTYILRPKQLGGN